MVLLCVIILVSFYNVHPLEEHWFDKDLRTVEYSDYTYGDYEPSNQQSKVEKSTRTTEEETAALETMTYNLINFLKSHLKWFKEGKFYKKSENPVGTIKAHELKHKDDRIDKRTVEANETQTTTLKPTPKQTVSQLVQPKSTIAPRYNNQTSLDTNSTFLSYASDIALEFSRKLTTVWKCLTGYEDDFVDQTVRFYLYTRLNPQVAELMDVNFTLINRSLQNEQRQNLSCFAVQNKNQPPQQLTSSPPYIRSKKFDVNCATKILVHGYTGSYKDKRMRRIKDAYLSTGRYNVILVDWEALASPPCYISVARHARYVGEFISKFLDGLALSSADMCKIHLIGFSLGAQVVGFAGSSTTLYKVPRITGLDPALPLFLSSSSEERLDRNDAMFVDVIHTGGGILALLDSLGHVDFYPNGGYQQPGCDISNLKCSHSRAPQYFTASIKSKYAFPSTLCSSWSDYVAGRCNTTDKTIEAFMGDVCSNKCLTGNYYLRTNMEEPFSLKQNKTKTVTKN